MIDEKVIICGVVKDGADDRFPFSINIVEKIGSLFKDYSVEIYENNSTDNTKIYLKAWRETNQRINYVSEDVNIPTLNHGQIKTEYIAYARNKVMEKLDEPKYSDFNYVVWIDLDFKYEPDYEGFIDSFSRREEWDAVFANGVAPDNRYWDWFALRDEVDPYGPEFIGDSGWYVEKRFSVVSDDGFLYPVMSAFGGCGIYRKEAILGCKYSGVVTKDLSWVYTKGQTEDYPFKLNSSATHSPAVCEHVPLHASMIRNGYNRLFINPKLKFRY